MIGRDSLNYALTNPRDTLFDQTTVYRESIFHDHLLQHEVIEPSLLEAASPDIAYWILGIALLFLSIMHLSFNKRIVLSVSAFFSYRKLEQLNEEGYLLLHPVHYTYALFYVMLIAVFIESFIPMVGQQVLMVNYGIYALAIALWILLKLVLYLLSGALYASPQMGRFLAAHYQSMTIVGAYLVLPLLLSFLLYDSNIIGFVLTTILLVLFVYRVLYAFWIIRQKTYFSLYQIFLYLCALEIAPAVIVLKLVIQDVITF